MKKGTQIFNGISFQKPADFETYFRPTKWSSRAYLKFLKSLDSDQQEIFLAHTHKVLSNHYRDKNTMEFLKYIRERSKNLNILHIGRSIPIASIEKINLHDNPDAANALIRYFAEMKSTGLILCNWNELATLIVDVFNIKYSRSTVLSKLFDYRNDCH